MNGRCPRMRRASRSITSRATRSRPAPRCSGSLASTLPKRATPDAKRNAIEDKGHLLFRILAYRLQADRLGDLDADSRRRLDRLGSGSPESMDRLVADLNRARTELRSGTLLTREWDGHLQRVTVLADGFVWNGKTYRSLSKVAFAITGSRWNGPRFFGLRDRPGSEVRP
jgi:Protein of unknown function (DUF2924)